MVDFVCVSTRSLKVKFKFEKIKICVVATYGPSEGNVEKSTIFWDNLNDVLDGVSRSFRLIVLGALNGWIGNQKRDGITGGFAVSGENENGMKVIDFCEERGMCVSNTFFKHKSCLLYTSDAADERSSVDLGGRRIIKKKKKKRE